MSTNGNMDTRNQKGTEKAPSGSVNRPTLKTYRESVRPATGTTPSGAGKSKSSAGTGQPGK